MTMLEEYQETRDKLRGKLGETRSALAATTDRSERQRLRQREAILLDMLREQNDVIRQLKAREPRKPKPKPVQTDALTWDFFERSGACWSDLEGTTWQQLQHLATDGTGREAGAVQQLVRQAMGSLSPVQARRMDRYFNGGETMQAISEAEGVARSTVSRCLRRALEGVERFVFARLYIQDCIAADGRFDYVRFAQNTAILTDRQLELLYIALATDEAYEGIALRLGLNRSTVCRTLSRASARLAQVSVEVERDVSACPLEEPGEEKEIAEKLGLPPVFYYRFLRRGELVGGLPRYHYELLRLRDAGKSAVQAAEVLGVAERTVGKYWRQYRDVDISGLPVPTDVYRPTRRFQEAARFDLRRALAAYCGAEEDTLLDRVDGATYRRMMAMTEGAGC